MNTREWLNERVSRLRAPAAAPQPAPVRSTHERLKARDAEGAEAAMRTHLTRQRVALRDLARLHTSRISA